MVVILLIAAVSRRADDEVPLSELGITLPKAIGKLRYERRQEFGAGLGYSVTYANKLCSVSLYVYNRGLKGIPAGKTGRLVAAELQTAADELAIAGKMNVNKNLKRMDGALPLSRAVIAKFAAAGYSFDIRGGACKGYVLVTGYRGHFFKVRATQYVVRGKTNDAEFNAFLEAVARHIKVPAK